MAKAYRSGRACEVLLDRDLGDTWAVTVQPPRRERGERPLPPLVVKLQGNGPAEILRGALQILERRGEIERWEE